MQHVQQKLIPLRKLECLGAGRIAGHRLCCLAYKPSARCQAAAPALMGNNRAGHQMLSVRLPQCTTSNERLTSGSWHHLAWATKTGRPSCHA